MHPPVSVRINYGHTKEADVETKATHRVMYLESASYLDDMICSSSSRLSDLNTGCSFRNNPYSDLKLNERPGEA